MIRGTAFKILKSKPVYTLLYRVSFIGAIIGMFYAYIIPNYGQYNSIEENAVQPELLPDSKVGFVLEEINKITS